MTEAEAMRADLRKMLTEITGYQVCLTQRMADRFTGRSS